MPIRCSGSDEQYSATQSLSARHNARAGSRSVTPWIIRPNVGYSAAAAIRSTAMSARRGPGSVPPARAIGSSERCGVWPGAAIASLRPSIRNPTRSPHAKR